MKFTIYEVWTRSRVVEAEDESDALINHELKDVKGMELCNWHAVPHDAKVTPRKPAGKKS